MWNLKDVGQILYKLRVIKKSILRADLQAQSPSGWDSYTGWTVSGLKGKEFKFKNMQELICVLVVFVAEKQISCTPTGLIINGLCLSVQRT